MIEITKAWMGEARKLANFIKHKNTEVWRVGVAPIKMEIDPDYMIALLDQNEELNNDCAMKFDMLMKQGLEHQEMLDCLKALGLQCQNIGRYGQLGLSPGECACSNCNARKVLEKVENGEFGKTKD